MIRNTTPALIAILVLAGSAAPLGAQPATTPVPAPAPAAATTSAAADNLWVVAADNLLMRSGDAYSFYPVAALKAGTVLEVDGERGGYLRVHYPAGNRALVKADEATVDGSKVKLSRPSALQALNMTAGPRASWNPLLERPLPPGTELVLIESVKDDGGKVTHHVVQPPASARGFVDRQGVRKATAAEAEAFAKASAPAPVAAPAPTPTPPPAPAPVAASTGATGSAPTPAPVPTPSASTGTTVAAGLTGATGTVGATGTTGIGTFTPPTIPPAPVGDATGAAAATGGAPQPPTQPLTAPTETPAPAPVVVTPPAPPPPPKPSPEEELMKMFERVRTTPLSQLTMGDLTEAITVFEGYRSRASADPSAGGRVGRIDGYLQVLTLMRDVKQARVDAETSGAVWQQRRMALAQQLADLEKQRVYQVIGLLLPSTIYDGVTLPKLYRLQSPEPGTFRTVGYIAPSEELQLDTKLGNVVGIIGTTAWDDTLKAPMVTASRVDIVSLAAIQGSPRSASEILNAPGANMPPAPVSLPAGTVEVRPQ